MKEKNYYYFVIIRTNGNREMQSAIFLTRNS